MPNKERKHISYRDWFLYDRDPRHERVKQN